MSTTKTKPEILSSCCCFGGPTEEVHVLLSECPIQRKDGQRTVKGVLTMAMDGQEREEVTCVYRSALNGTVTPACEHYDGTKKVKRDGRTKYKVLCGAVKS